MMIVPGSRRQFYQQLAYVMPGALPVFHDRVLRVLDISDELAQADSFDTLCQRAIALGRSVLGFERMGLWFLDPERQLQLGTFGIDEHGTLRDERRYSMPADLEIFGIRPGTTTMSMHKPLKNLNGNIVGFGSYLCATIWDDADLVGYISADNLLQHRPLTTEDAEVLAAYAYVLGRL